MTSSKPRRYLSHVVHVGLLSHGTGTSLTHRLPLRLTEPTVTQYSSTHPSSLSQLSIISKLSPHRPVPCSLYPPINKHCTNHRIADPQTKIQTYSTTKKQTNKQYTTNIIIIIIHVTVTSTPRLMIPTVTSYKPLPLHNAYSKTYIISLCHV